MEEFFEFLEDLIHGYPIHVDIGYNKVADWCISVKKRGCASEYPNAIRDGNDAVLCFVQDSDMKLCFAKAQVALKEWLRENEGGY